MGAGDRMVRKGAREQRERKRECGCCSRRRQRLAGHDKEAKDAVAELRKVDPAFTVKTVAGWHPSDDPTFKAQFARYLEGLRKAGVPEGTAKTN